MLARLLVTMATLALFACSSSEGPSGNPPGLIKSELERDRNPDVSAAELTQLTADNADFGWKLYHQALKDGKNLFFSPYSISSALGMTYAGARGATETEMAEALRFSLGQERLHPALNALALELERRAEEGGPDALLRPRPFKLNVANAIFGQMGYPFLASYLDTLALHYGSGLWEMDFYRDPEAARVEINRWVAGETSDRIKNFLPEKATDKRTRLVLVNAIYFSASWGTPFDASDTREEAFTLLDGASVRVPTMHGMRETGFVAGPNFRAAELPYDGQELAMLVIVPDAGQFSAVEASLSAAEVARMRGAMSPHSVSVSFPRFEYRSKFSAKDQLEALGMRQAFTGAADFSGMDGKRDLAIDEVLHEAFVKVDERGTEAAAATAVVVHLISLPPPPPPPAELRVDRPFIFAIVDRTTGSTLFIGRVLDPTA